LYIVSVIVLMGAELNAQIYPKIVAHGPVTEDESMEKV
jgi:hypothetical protein